MMKSAATVIPSRKIERKRNINFFSRIEKPIDWFTLRKKNKYENTQNLMELQCGADCKPAE